jgi:hypothetical protein
MPRTLALALHIKLQGGRVVDLKAVELVIDFGSNHRLLIKPDGFSPANDNSEQLAESRQS